jgi:hypothetical protein
VTGPVEFKIAAATERAGLTRRGVIYATRYGRQTRTGVETWLLAARRLARGRYTLTTHHDRREITTRRQVAIR